MAVRFLGPGSAHPGHSSRPGAPTQSRDSVRPSTTPKAPTGLRRESGRESVRPDEALPAIPDKIYFRIGEVAHLVGVEPHVLRYWEHEFRSIRPTKSQRG